MVSSGRDNPSPELPWARYFSTHLFKKVISTVYMRWVRQLGMARQLTWAGRAGRAGRVTRVGDTTFSHVNGLATRDETVGPVLSLLQWAFLSSCRQIHCVSMWPEPSRIPAGFSSASLGAALVNSHRQHCT